MDSIFINHNCRSYSSIQDCSLVSIKPQVKPFHRNAALNQRYANQSPIQMNRNYRVFFFTIDSLAHWVSMARYWDMLYTETKKLNLFFLVYLIHCAPSTQKIVEWKLHRKWMWTFGVLHAIYLIRISSFWCIFSVVQLSRLQQPPHRVPPQPSHAS